MVEVWVDGRKILFGGDMGPDHAPILISPAQHFEADAVLVESTYGVTARTEISYEEFGKKIQAVIDRGGDVLIPTFAIHKSQLLIYTIQRLKDEGILAEEIPVYCDSATVHRGNLIYDAYTEYHDREARKFADKHGSLFYLGKYREGQVRDFINAHGNTPSIYISTSGMLAFAASPRHLQKMAGESKNAIFIPGYQAPNTVGRQLLDGRKNVRLLIEDGNSRELNTNIKLEVDRVSGFSSHATGEQILEWVSKFQEIGAVYVVHGDEDRSTGLAEKMVEMGVDAQAPKRNETFTVKSDRVKPGEVPELTSKEPPAPAAVDQ
jgi:metallo-beta-lactamase family protein